MPEHSRHCSASQRRAYSEQAGFESLWVGDHIALPVDAPDPATEPRLEALTALTYLAAVTSTVRLGVGVLVLAQRQPVLLAKQLTTLDVLSGGRLSVGIGVGYLKAELAALGANLDHRAGTTDEYLAAMVALWDGGPARFSGQHVNFDGVVQSPRPLRQPHPPIIIGGHVTASFERAAHFGDRWFGWDLTPSQTADTIATLRSARQRSQRFEQHLKITIKPPGVLTAATVDDYTAAGAHRLIIQPDDFEASAVDHVIDSHSAWV